MKSLTDVRAWLVKLHSRFGGYLKKNATASRAMKILHSCEEDVTFQIDLSLWEGLTLLQKDCHSFFCCCCTNRQGTLNKG